jgi:hypothetical protein
MNPSSQASAADLTPEAEQIFMKVRFTASIISKVISPMAEQQANCGKYRQQLNGSPAIVVTA